MAFESASFISSLTASFFFTKSSAPPASYSSSMHLWIIQSLLIVHRVASRLKPARRVLCYRTWVLHGCGRLVHGRSNTQEDLLSPGDPAWGRRETRTHWVTAAAGQGPLPALPIATREDGSVRCRLTSTHTHAHTHLISDTGHLVQASHLSFPQADEKLSRRIFKHTDEKTQVPGIFWFPNIHVNEAAVHD